MTRHASANARRFHANHRAFCIFGIAAAAVGCKGPERPAPPPAATAQTISATRAGYAIRGVGGDGATVYASFAARASELRTSGTMSGGDGRAAGGPAGGATAAGVVDGRGATSIVEARRGDSITWTAQLSGTAGELAIAGAQLAIAVSAHGSMLLGAGTGSTGTQMTSELRGDPAAVVVALDRTTGAQRWQRPFESTEWAIIAHVAALGDDIVVAGSFGGTLRVLDKVVTSGGGSDGFVARLAADGTLGWLMRLGGPFADGVQGLAVRAGADATTTRIAIAGTFSLAADILGEPLASTDAKSPFGDAFVAELDGNGARRWSASFGSRAEDAVAGVTIDSSGDVVVAASVTTVLSIAGAMLVPRGAGDGLVVWYSDSGELGHATLLGGNDFDGLRSITTAGDHVIVSGFFSGTLQLGDRTLGPAGGGDDSFIAALDGNGTVATGWHVGGSGREEVTSLAAFPGGFVAGVAHTGAAAIDDTKLAAPPPGATGAALVVRGR